MKCISKYIRSLLSVCSIIRVFQYFAIVIHGINIPEHGPWIDLHELPQDIHPRIELKIHKYKNICLYGLVLYFLFFLIKQDFSSYFGSLRFKQHDAGSVEGPPVHDYTNSWRVAVLPCERKDKYSAG
jgi:hypothetical protein